MTDLDPAIWENETLGAAAQNENLERLEKQAHEDRQAKVEGREPREVIHENTYPGWKPEVNPKTGTVASNYQNVHFADETQADIPEGSGPVDETAAGLEGETVESNGESESADSNSTQEDGPTQWT